MATPEDVQHMRYSLCVPTSRPCEHDITLKTEAAWTSETLVSYIITQYNEVQHPEDEVRDGLRNVPPPNRSGI